MDRQKYQENFYTLSEKVRDSYSRQRKADKIVQVLTRYAGSSLGSDRCLDIGCSSGIITTTLASYFSQTVGLEYDKVALRAIDATAREKVQFVRGDAMTLPLSNDALDVIICTQVYEHVPDEKKLVDEIHRVLRPGGLVFFSGPNWLFPIEPHHFLPFLHWLPGQLADICLRLTGRGHHYYEHSRHLWGLRKLMGKFIVRDITVDVLRNFYLPDTPRLEWIVRNVPEGIWKLLIPFLPNFNWILYKPEICSGSLSANSEY